MLSGSTALVAVRRRDGLGLSKVAPGLREDSRSATPMLQMLFAELASLKQQLNAMVVDQPSSLQRTEPLGQKSDSVPFERVRPKQLRKIFD